ncbi:hypothetical protein LXL04_010503 [Taraxacum kok-saghyz]
MSLMEGVEHLKIRLEDIKLATNNFDDDNFIAHGGFGKVYKGELTLSGQLTTVAVKRLDRTFGQGHREFLMEIQMLSCYRHKNLISLIGFCDEGKENILVYEHAEHGSLDKYLSDSQLSWMQRLEISLGAARGFSYLHNDVGPQHRVLHRDIKSSNILLSENWEVKISDFGLSKIGPSNVEFTFLVTNACGTFGYVDPQYLKTGILTKESDVYSFGVVLFEILCGRLAIVDKYQDERRFLASLAQLYYEHNKLNEIIFENLRNQIKVDSLDLFSMVAYQCLNENRSQRPTMRQIVEKLEKAIKLQVCSNVSGLIRVGTCGSQTNKSSISRRWSFELEKNHKLVKIIIDHGDVIYSLMFTTESRGVIYTSKKAGGMAGGNKASESSWWLNDQIMFDVDEELIGINGTHYTTRDGTTIISSLSFETNKRNHGPFGRSTETFFSIPWDKGSFVGFYGFCGYSIYGIGVYIKATEEIIRVGTWGKTRPPGQQNIWSFPLRKHHQLKKMTICIGHLIYSLRFTTQYGGLIHTSEKFGSWNGGDTISEVTFVWEEITGISGTIARLRGNDPGLTVISSISLVTNKNIYGPFGRVRGRPFTVPWEVGSFAGFYGLAGYYIDSIGVYLKAVS